MRAGLALAPAVRVLRNAYAMPLEIRVGIATGLVVVGELTGEGEARERGVVGETPNLAARLQGVAEPGQVVVSGSTRRLLGGTFELGVNDEIPDKAVCQGLVDHIASLFGKAPAVALAEIHIHHPNNAAVVNPTVRAA